MGEKPLNLAESFVVANAATRSPWHRDPNQHDVYGWSVARDEPGLFYVVNENFGILSSEGVFSPQTATIKFDDFGRQAVIDAAGVVEWFLASNISAVLAQTAPAPKLPRTVFLKSAQDFRPLGGGSLPVYVAADPFLPLYERLDALANSDKKELGEAPSAEAIGNARRVLDAASAEGLLPKKVLRGSSGNIYIYFSNGAQYAEVECDSEGDILMVVSDRVGSPEPWLSGAERLRTDLTRIRAILF